MEDICYILGKNSRWSNEEIRYSLRSVEKHLTGFRNLHIVGEDPMFLKNFHYHPLQEDPLEFKENNILNKLRRACSIDGLSDYFLFMNDDHFLNKDFRINAFPYFYSGTIKDILRDRDAEDSYTIAMQNALRFLEQKKLPIKYFDVHTPMRIQKKIFKGLCGVWPKEKYGYIVKSIYANCVGFVGTPEPDYKINQGTVESIYTKIAPSKVFSCGSAHALKKSMLQVLAEKYPNKSRWEI